MPGQASAVVAAAASQVGAYGNAGNDTPYSDWYQATHPLAGNDFRGEDWCAMFVSWCFAQAGLDLHFAWVPSGVAMYRAYGLLDMHPRPGDVVFYDWAGDGVATHTGIVEGVDLDGTVHTIEGNRGVGGDPAPQVGRHTIPGDAGWDVVIGFGHPAYDAPPPPQVFEGFNGADSAFGPTLAQLAMARAAGVDWWAWYATGEGAYHVWTDAEVDVLTAGGLTSSVPLCVPRLDLSGSPVADAKATVLRAQARGWTGLIGLDTEASMRGNPRLVGYVTDFCLAALWVGWQVAVYGGANVVPSLEGVHPWWIIPGATTVPLGEARQNGQRRFGTLSVDTDLSAFGWPTAKRA